MGKKKIAEEIKESFEEEVLLDEVQNEEVLIEETKAADDYSDKYMRLMAEFDNFRKRTAKEKLTVYDDGVKNTVTRFLDVADCFERAICSVTDTDAREDSFFKGVGMIFKQFKEVLEGLGVSEIAAIGGAFDPNLHEAVMHTEDENYSENEVVEEFQKGYTYKDKVIRYSKVKVAN